MDKYFTSPEGKAIYPYLTHPDTEFKTDGEYHTKLECNLEDSKPLIHKIKSVIAEQIKLQNNDNQKKAVKKAPLPFKELGDKIIFNFKLSAKGTRKDDGKPFTQKPQIVDAKKRPMEDQQIWGDSILKIICEPYGWNMPIGIGCTLRLKVVQVVKLVTGKPQNDILSGLTEVEQQPTEVREDQQQGVNL